MYTFKIFTFLIIIVAWQQVNGRGYDFEAINFNGYFGSFRIGSEIKVCHKGIAKKSKK